ncbi:uncharacterized protein C16orf52 homolog A-like isoform X2 [Tachypleus tridentatus]|uniref:uncharacterized protein C16orf52 homolog A-like isoform X2 n=1 Tax=Tachypleus tridentatus TaxID=6853 RepID=UPI003FD02CA9
MDKLTVISGALFLSADIFAVVSLILPDWIVTEVGGDTRIGLVQTCMTIYGRSQLCFSPNLQPEWMLTLICIIIGALCVTATIGLLFMSRWNMHVIHYARWVGFSATVIFPLGFTMEEIGGEPYQLPSHHHVGLSYIFFVLALWITVISELFAGKVDGGYLFTRGFVNKISQEAEWIWISIGIHLQLD